MAPLTRIIDRYVYRELLPPFAIGVGVFTFFILIDRIYQLTNLVITKNVPFGLVCRPPALPAAHVPVDDAAAVAAGVGAPGDAGGSPAISR